MKAKQRLSLSKRQLREQQPAEAPRTGPLAVSPAVREREALSKHGPEPFRPVLALDKASGRPAKQEKQVKEAPAIVQFARQQSEHLQRHHQILSAAELTEALDKIAEAFRQDSLFRGHVQFSDLYRRALLALSRYDLQLNLGAAARGGMADRSLAAFWRSYFGTNPSTDGVEYFATLKTATALALFIKDAKLFADDGSLWSEEDWTELFYKTQDFFVDTGYLAFLDPEEEIFSLNPHALTRVLRQLCWFIDNFYQINQKKYVHTPHLSCEAASQVADPASLVVEAQVAATTDEEGEDDDKG